MIFRQPALNIGWSETYYTNDADHEAAIAEIQALLLLRIDILSPLCYSDYLRISKTDVPGDSLVRETNIQGTAPGDPVLEPSACLLLRLEAGPTARGRKYLHGVTEEMFLSDGNYNIGWAGEVALAAFLEKLAPAVDPLYGIPVGTDPGPAEYSFITAALPQRLTSHKVGRPFGLRRGRS